MTKEEIIIDGVNVKNCKRRIGKNSYCQYFKSPCADNNFNCIWKQCERLKEENEALHNIIEQVRQEVEEDITCESQECGCDDYGACLECFKNTILKIIKNEEN